MSSDLGNLAIMSENIQYYLDKKGINSVRLAEDLGFNYTTVRNWIQARTYPRIDKIELLANYFGIEKSDLVESKKEKSISSSALDEMLDEAVAWQGKPISDTDRAIVKAQLAAYFENKKEDVKGK